jgi:hypothetical protein
MDSPPDQDVQTIWLRTENGWRVYFHQGTLITTS